MMSSSAARDSRPPSWGVLIAAGVIIGLLALNWVAAVARFQVNGVYWDQWIYLKPLFEGGGWLDLFTQQHGPHRQGIAFIFTAWLMELTAWDSRVEALWIASLLVVAAVLALIWKYRLTGRLRWWDLWIPMAALAMRQYENVILVPNASHSMFPLVLAMVAALLLARPLTLGRWLGLGGVGLLALFTGFGIFVWGALVVVAGLVLARAGRDRQRWVAPLGGALVLGGALIWFLLGYVFNPASPGATFPHFPLGDYPLFVVRMLASRMGMLGGGSAALFWGSVVLILGVVAWGHAGWKIIKAETVKPGWVAAVFFITIGLGYAGFTALGRVHLGVEGGEASRYTPLMISWWLGLVAWAAAASSRVWGLGAAVLGWAMVVVPWADLWDRPWRDWPGTLGMSERSRTAIVWTSSYKTKWLLAWQETGDWQEAERRVPFGVHPGPEGSPMASQMAFMQEQRVSFLEDPDTPYAWMPWWNPLGVSWVQGMGGEHRQWIAEEGIFLVDGNPGAFLNLKVEWKTAGLPDDAPVAVRLGDHEGQTTYAELRGGLSLPAPVQRDVLILRSLAGVEPIHPPNDPRPASFLVADPTVTAVPYYAVKWFSENDPGLLDDTVIFTRGEGFHDWEHLGGFVWTGAAGEIELRSRRTRYLNLVIEGRYAPVDQGDVRVRLNEQHWDLPWKPEGLRLSLAIPGGRSHKVTLRNLAGAKTPASVGESDDARFLALRLNRISFDEAPAFPLVE